MKRCSAPCTNNLSETEYKDDVRKSIEYLSSSKKNMLNNLQKEMKKASDKLEFEKASEIRDKINQVKIIDEKQAVTPNQTNADIFSVEKTNNYAGICIISIRDGKIRGTKTHLVKNAYFCLLYTSPSPRD